MQEKLNWIINMEFVITYKNSHSAIKSKKKLLKYFPSLQLIPTPREISSECGFTVLIDSLKIELIIDKLHENHLHFLKIYKRDEENYTEEFNNESY